MPVRMSLVSYSRLVHFLNDDLLYSGRSFPTLRSAYPWNKLISQILLLLKHVPTLI